MLWNVGAADCATRVFQTVVVVRGKRHSLRDPRSGLVWQRYRLDDFYSWPGVHHQGKYCELAVVLFHADVREDVAGNARIFSDALCILCRLLAGDTAPGNRAGLLLLSMVEANGQNLEPYSPDGSPRIDPVLFEKHHVCFAAADAIRGLAVPLFFPTGYGFVRGSGRISHLGVLLAPSFRRMVGGDASGNDVCDATGFSHLDGHVGCWLFHLLQWAGGSLFCRPLSEAHPAAGAGPFVLLARQTCDLLRLHRCCGRPHFAD